MERPTTESETATVSNARFARANERKVGWLMESIRKNQWPIKITGRLGWALLLALAVAGLLSFPSVRTYLGTAWPYLLFLLCPLMHVFMHRSHAGHGGHMSAAGPGPDQEEKPLEVGHD